MTPQNKPGTCLLCRAVVNKTMALRHIRNCLRSSGWPAGVYPSFIIRIQDMYDSSCWMTILARHDARLSDLDSLVRDVRTEGCSHPGVFTIGDTCMNTADGMAVPLADILRPGSSFTYECNSDSPTTLELKVLDTTPVMPPKGSLRVIAQTTCPSSACNHCGKEAYNDGNDGEEGCGTPGDLLPECVNAPVAGNIRNPTICTRCEEFCTRIDNEMTANRCREMTNNLATHPDTPLSRGNEELWSAAIVYMACQDEGLISRGRSGSSLPQEITGFFDLELSSIRNKVTALKKRLAECCPKEQD